MLAKNVVLQVNGINIPSMIDIQPSGTTWATRDTTNHDAATPVKTLSPTVRTDGILAVTLLPWDPSGAGHGALKTLKGSGASATFTLIYPGGTIGSYSWSGYVTDLQMATPVNDIVSAKVQITPGGAVYTFAATPSVVVSDSQAGIYTTGEAIQLQVSYDKTVNVTGTPRIAITLGSGTVYANYVSGSGGTVLVFSYTVQGGDSATAGQMSITSPIDLNGGTINDLVPAAATLTFTAPSTSSFTVN